MLTKRAKWALLIGSILGILICVFGCANMIASSSEYNKRYPSEKLPIRTLSIQIDENQREDYLPNCGNFPKNMRLNFI